MREQMVAFPPEGSIPPRILPTHFHNSLPSMRISQRLRKATFPLRRGINRLIYPSVWNGGPPCGTFHEIDCIRSQAVKGGIAEARNDHPTIAPDSEIIAAGLGQSEHADWTSVWSLRDDAVLLAPSLAHVDVAGRVCLEATYGPHTWSDPVWGRRQGRPIRELSGNFTSIVSRWNDGKNYYHWFLDGLTRLVHLKHFPADCKILVPADLPGFARRSIELVGLAHRVVETRDEDLRIEHYWFAGPTMLSGCPDPLGVDWLQQNLPRHAGLQRQRRIYIERSAPTRQLTNAAEVRNWFIERGWEVVDPGELSLDEQIALFGEARAIVGTHGAGLTNLLWASPDTRVLEFMPSRRRNGCYAGISAIKGFSHQTWVCPSNRRGEMRIPLDQLSLAVTAMMQKPALPQ